MATKTPEPMFKLDIYGQVIGVDVKADGRFYARTKAGETAKTLEGLQRSLEAKYPPSNIGGVAVEEMWDGRHGIVIGRAPNDGRRGSYFLVRWQGYRTTEIEDANSLILPKTAEHNTRIEQFNTDIQNLEEAAVQKEEERDAYIESLSAKDLLNTTFPKRKK